MSYEILDSKKTYKGKVISVKEDLLCMPNGKEAIREVVVRGNASAVLPIDSDGNIIFVRQYRHPFGEMMLEIPAGMIEKEEDPFDCIKRELEEETGYYSENIQFLYQMYPSVGFCTEKIYLYLAKELKKGMANPDEDEFIALERYSMDEAVCMIFDGRIKDGKTIAAVLAYKNMHK